MNTYDGSPEDGSPEDEVALAQALIRCQSITPKDDGALDIVEAHLKGLGFTCHRLVFGEVENVYARLGEAAPFLCFAGHTDVVPTGDLAAWDHPPFAADIVEGRLYGRGASDMKGAIAAFLAASARYLKNNPQPAGSLGFLITGDEEATAIDGTQKVLQWMAQRGEKIDDCLVGEPSNLNKMGEAIKIGRRGSLNMDLIVHGQQGHAANPHLACNPVPVMVQMLARLDAHILDEGTENFMPSNLEITSIDIGNPVRNVIPAAAHAQWNIRYNDRHSPESLEQIALRIADEVKVLHSKISYELKCQNNGSPFLTQPCAFSDLVRDVVHQSTGRKPDMATNGGTSDARYIKDYARVVEFGLTTATIHKINEWAAVDDIKQLADIYETIIRNYFRR